MPRHESRHLRQFLLFVFALLIPCFAIWGFGSAAIVTPVIGLVHLTLSSWFPGIVYAVYQQGADLLVMSTLDQVGGQLVQAENASDGLGFRVNTRIVTFSIPFYAALHFATDKKNYLGNLFWGLIFIYPFIFLGLICICLKELMVGFGMTFLEQPNVLVPGPDLIGIAYQLSVLIVPTLLPVLVWAWQSRDTPLFAELLRVKHANSHNS
tara:strand:- start:95061 stop:95687 length:627 start_codon:yes stop_codon:yes gene_type:complete